MPTTCDIQRLEDLRRLDDLVAKIRGELKLHQPQDVVVYYLDERTPGNSVLVLASGYGQFQLVEAFGLNPHNRDVLNEVWYDDEDSACNAAYRLAIDLVPWQQRDTLADYTEADTETGN